MDMNETSNIHEWEEYTQPEVVVGFTGVFISHAIFMSDHWRSAEARNWRSAEARKLPIVQTFNVVSEIHDQSS